MEYKKILFNKTSFEEVLRSAYETLDRECYGFLFGEIVDKRGNRLWVVESAHPVQLAKRYPCSSYPESERGNWSLSTKNIGGYHSHPPHREQTDGVRTLEQGNLVLSKEDKELIKSLENHVEVVIAIKKVTRKSKIVDNPLVISGYLGYNGNLYRVDIGAYFHNGRIRKALIEAPRSILRLMR